MAIISPNTTFVNNMPKTKKSSLIHGHPSEQNIPNLSMPTFCSLKYQMVCSPRAIAPWLNCVPRKMPDVRSRYALHTNMRRFIYCMLYLMYECSPAFMIRSVSLPLITPFSHDSLTKIRPLPLISVKLLFIMYCYNLQTRCISLVLKF